MRPLGTTPARLTGRVRIRGWADDPDATGELEISPLARRRIRYRLHFTAADGRALTLDGWKSITPGRPVRSMTVLPFTLYERHGAAPEHDATPSEAGPETPTPTPTPNEATPGRRIGTGSLRFPLATGLLPFLASFRFPRPPDDPGGIGPAGDTRDDHTGTPARALIPARAGTPAPTQLLAPRWSGEPGRTEVWYTTLTDPATGTGLWLHHELVAPTDPARPAHAHGWIALYPPEGPVAHARFGPEPWQPGPDADGFAAREVRVRPGRLTGTAAGFTWDLTERPADEPLFTFPRWSWRRPLLPAAQMLPAARSTYRGTVTHPGGTLTLTGAPGATARIYGHGNARRWSWLHADLGGGDVLEVVAAVSTRPVLRALPPLVFLRLRRGGRTWPRRAERTAVGWAGPGRFKARLGLPRWTVTGRAGLRRIHVTVTQPPDRTLALDYHDPDGSHAVCRNSERADAVVRLERWRGRWRTEALWTLDGTAHAEVGER
ncbi:hypothetical protein [Streptomyces sp. NPDC093225]|uniref:hypothetical protein n=1 Tax=Streptomyces sp. NPDC093225 TaxID=3366034 RepID=UPI00382474C3